MKVSTISIISMIILAFCLISKSMGQGDEYEDLEPIRTNSISIPVHYTEPCENNDGSVPDDLDTITIYGIMGNNTRLLLKEIRVSSQKGCVDVVTAVEIPLGEGLQETFNIVLTATDFYGNESGDSNGRKVTIDRRSTEAPTLHCE